MDWNEAVVMARKLMNEHGLEHVPLQSIRHKMTCGRCRFSRDYDGKMVVTAIELSKPVTRVNEAEQVRDTVLHEIAHALVGVSHGHDFVWKMKAREIGAVPEAKTRTAKPAPGAYHAVCACGIDHQFYRMPKRGRICLRCRERLDIRRVK